MSVITTAWVNCNHLDKDKPLGKQGCPAQVTDGSGGHGASRTPGLPENLWLWTRADARRAARKLGWAAGVRHDGTGQGTFDYCPDHRDRRSPR